MSVRRASSARFQASGSATPRCSRFKRKLSVFPEKCWSSSSDVLWLRAEKRVQPRRLRLRYHIVIITAVRAFQHAFSTNDCSRNVYIKKNGFTLHRNPIAQSTDGARTKIGFSEGRHAWEVWWEGPLGTVAVIGIATKRAPMQCQGYVALLGSDDQSWGWNLVDNNLLHNGEVNGSFPQCNNAPKYQIGERIRVILDMEDKTLAFERGYEFLGVAFRGLPKACLYPAVSAVYGNTEVTLVYLGKPLDG
ncbi:PREDICTED: F-box/SPRY domain-containing protein 1 [Myotis davidii]|uniref:F-box/SPRY domain-containing protein 1 n=1 Tax=Myotis davidii TaxID=225400 RepID=UPI0003EC33BC|nr:PREDICTED: F-box/SPRY domain-containing protein 1 [Myotis davidii]